jgi:hypothetical protein
VVLVPMRHHQNDLVFSDFSVRDQGVGGSNPLAPTIFPCKTQFSEDLIDEQRSRFYLSSTFGPGIGAQFDPQIILSKCARALR